MALVVGVDLGGTKIAAALVNPATGHVNGRRQISTEAHQGADAVLKRIASLVEDVRAGAGLSQSAITGVGLGVPAMADMTEGRTLLVPNLPGDWQGKPVLAVLRQHLPYTLALINDARAFALAEASWGAGKGASCVAALTIGTGIGGGIVLNGALHLGFDGMTAEIGHQTIEPNGPRCGCGNNGCLEALASGPAIAALGVRAIMQGMNTRIGALVELDIGRVTPEVIGRAAEMGDEVARDILHRAGTYLGIGIANVVTILSPETVVIGGGVSRLGDWLLNPIRETLARRCRTIPVERVQVVRAALNDDAGVIGAAMWAYSRLKTEEHHHHVG